MPRARAALAKRVSRISPSRACAGVTGTGRRHAGDDALVNHLGGRPSPPTPAGRARETARGAGAPTLAAPSMPPKGPPTATIRSALHFHRALPDRMESAPHLRVTAPTENQ